MIPDAITFKGADALLASGYLDRLTRREKPNAFVIASIVLEGAAHGIWDEGYENTDRIRDSWNNREEPTWLDR